ncbi:MAG: hypothetical protein K8L91_21200 [Anaerolineae bacterium]|nr:hypothetical protein [Anaerolineae bacterium]
MELKKRWVAVVVIVLVVVGAMQAATNRPSVVNGQAGSEDSDAPYLYYFDSAARYWVIEKADGTDKHILGEGLVQRAPDAYTVDVGGPGWSPSGQWFAFTSRSVFGMIGSTPSEQAHIISVDGRQHLTLLDDLARLDAGISMAWSPVADLLMMAATYTQYAVDPNTGSPDYSMGTIEVHLRLIDPAVNAIIAQVHEAIPFDNSARFDMELRREITMRWQAAGDKVILDYATYVRPNDVTTIYVLDVATQIFSVRRLSGVIYPNVYTGPAVSSAGEVAYQTRTGVVIENVLSGVRRIIRLQLPDDSSGTNPPRLIWSPTGSSAVLVAQDVGLLHLSDDEIDLQWLGFPARLPQREYESPVISVQLGWSPDGQHLLLQTLSNTVYHVDANTGARTTLMPPIERHFPVWGWWGASRAYVTGPYDPEKQQQTLFVYNFSTRLQPVEEITISRMWWSSPPSLSPDERLVAYVYDSAIIQNRETGDLVRVRPDADSFFSQETGEVEWSADSQWVLIFDDAHVASGATGQRHLGITRYDGTGRRDLGYSPSPSRITLDWLPARVNPADLPIPLPDNQQFPAQILHGNQWIWYLDWSPDGQQLATGTGGWYDLDDIQIWSLAEGEITTEFPELYRTVGSSVEVDWQLSASGGYTAQLVERSDSSIGDFPSSHAISPDGRYAIVSTDDVGPVMVDVQSQQVLFAVSEPYDRVSSASFSPDGRLVAVAYMDRPSVIYDIQTQTIIGHLPDTSFAVVFSPDGEYLAVGVSWDVEIWRVSDLIGAEN